MSKQPLTDEKIAELRALEQLRDEDIDTSDIPEITDEQWLSARRGNLYRPIKQSVTIRLDADILAWFKDHAGGRGYQTDINAALREYVATSTKKHG
ncbi:BrnA antitoxin family protein [Rhizobium sp. P32RR-XVIII]|uniref:BrnA antitoxin family protein n=1 Tax=Rhizobium sp. P32RR-XVIII TaxID=2726738 RepID=UPI0014567997|nr:BrnA antitoxin family protein [Rhizobium sp. P32RR-XVIII]NLS04768.1 BrnA antitoxin family protein [Rhizobium sp. P32RR-XVIII]